MKIKLLLILAIVLISMLNLIGQHNEEEIIFEDATDTPFPKKIKYLDDLGKYVINKKGKNFTIIEQDGKIGVLNSVNKVIIEPYINGKIEREQNGFKVKHNKRYGFHDIAGNELLKPIYKGLFFKDDYIITIASKSGLYEVGKGYLLDTIYCHVGRMGGSNKDLFKISKNCNDYTIVQIDTLNSNLEYEYQMLLYLGVINKYLVKKEDKFGLLNNNAAQVIPLQYEKLIPFKNYTIALKDKRYGIIDYENNKIIPFSYGHIEPGLLDDFIVSKDGKFGTVNIEEEIIIPFKYNHLGINLNVDSGYIFEENYKEGLISFDGKTILEPKYTQIKGIYKRLEDWSTVIEGYMLRDIDGKFGFANLEGKEVSPCIFDSIKQSKGEEPYPLTVTLGEYTFKTDKLGKCIGDCPPKEVYEFQRN